MAKTYRSVGLSDLIGLIVIVVANIAVEAVTQASLAGWIPAPKVHGTLALGFRDWHSFYTTLQPGIYFGGEPTFAGQRFTAPLSYGFVHVGLVHLWANMIPLVILGWSTIRRVGQAGFLGLYFAAMILSGLGYVWWQGGGAGVAGASGAIYGMGGAWLVWLWADRSNRPLRWLPPLAWFEFMILANLVFYILLEGRLAWQLHVAGILIGMLAAPLLRRQPAM